MGGGVGSKIGQNCQQIVLKDCQHVYRCHEFIYELRKDIVEEILSVHSRETVWICETMCKDSNANIH